MLQAALQEIGLPHQSKKYVDLLMHQYHSKNDQEVGVVHSVWSLPDHAFQSWMRFTFLSLLHKFLRWWSQALVSGRCTNCLTCLVAFFNCVGLWHIHWKRTSCVPVVCRLILMISWSICSERTKTSAWPSNWLMRITMGQSLHKIWCFCHSSPLALWRNAGSLWHSCGS